MKFLACCVLPDKKLCGNCLYWLNILYWKFFHHALKNRVCREILHCRLIEYTFTFRIVEQLAPALKNRVCPELTELNIYFSPFRIFEQVVLALKTELPWNFSLYWNIFYHLGFLSNLRLPWKQLPWNFSLYWYMFYHSGFLSNLRLPWKQNLPWNFSRREGGSAPTPASYAYVCQYDSFCSLVWLQYIWLYT